MLGFDSTSTEGIGEEIATACYSILSELEEGKMAAQSEAGGWTWVATAGVSCSRPAPNATSVAATGAPRRRRDLRGTFSIELEVS